MMHIKINNCNFFYLISNYQFENLDFLGNEPWETPFGKVVWGNHVVDSWYTGYGDMKGMNGLGDEHGVDQSLIYIHGNSYLKENYRMFD